MIASRRLMAIVAFALLPAAEGSPSDRSLPRLPTGDVEAVAAILADAASLVTADPLDRRRLTRLLAVLDGLGAHSVSPVDDPVIEWRLATADPVPYRGRLLGPGYRKSRIEAGQSEALEQIFVAGQTADVAVSAPGGTPIAMKIEESNGATVCVRDPAPRSRCSWMPLASARYRVSVSNPSGRAADYFLVTN